MLITVLNLCRQNKRCNQVNTCVCPCLFVQTCHQDQTAATPEGTKYGQAWGPGRPLTGDTWRLPGSKWGQVDILREKVCARKHRKYLADSVMATEKTGKNMFCFFFLFTYQTLSEICPIGDIMKLFNMFFSSSHLDPGLKKGLQLYEIERERERCLIHNHVAVQ